MSSESGNSEDVEFVCDVGYDDWVDIANSEFVDYVEGRHSVAFVFEHDELGLHGIKFNSVSCVLEAVSFDKRV